MVLSFTPKDPTEVPLGRRSWEVAGAEACEQGGGSLTLALTACTPGNFTCDDGTCVPADMRCDYQVRWRLVERLVYSTTVRLGYEVGRDPLGARRVP